MAVPTRVDEPGGRVDQQTEATKRALAFESSDQVVGQTHPLERRAEDELARVQDEGPLVVDLDELRQLLLRRFEVDERLARVVEDAEEAVDAYVNARGLNQRLVVRLDPDSFFLQEAPDRPVGENHARDCKAVVGDPDQARPYRLCRLDVRSTYACAPFDVRTRPEGPSSR